MFDSTEYKEENIDLTHDEKILLTVANYLEDLYQLPYQDNDNPSLAYQLEIDFGKGKKKIMQRPNHSIVIALVFAVLLAVIFKLYKPYLPKNIQDIGDKQILLMQIASMFYFLCHPSKASQSSDSKHYQDVKNQVGFLFAEFLVANKYIKKLFNHGDETMILCYQEVIFNTKTPNPDNPLFCMISLAHDLLMIRSTLKFSFKESIDHYMKFDSRYEKLIKKNLLQITSGLLQHIGGQVMLLSNITCYEAKIFYHYSKNLPSLINALYKKCREIMENNHYRIKLIESHKLTSQVKKDMLTKNSSQSVAEESKDGDKSSKSSSSQQPSIISDVWLLVNSANKKNKVSETEVCQLSSNIDEELKDGDDDWLLIHR